MDVHCKVKHKALLPLGEPQESRRDDDQDKVENEEREQDPNVSPPISVGDVQRKEEIFSRGVRAIPTPRGIVGVIEVSTKRPHELFGPRATRLTARRVEHGKLFRLTLNLESVQLSGDHRTQHASVRIEVIQPTPRPRRDLGVRNRDTAKSGEDGREERVKQHRDLDGRRNGTDELRKRDTEKLDEDEDEELEPSSVDTCSTLTESDRVDHQDPVQNGAEDRVRDLGDQLGDGERLGRVDPAVVFPNEDHPVQNPQRRQLSLDDSGQNGHPEQCEHPRLEVTNAPSELQVTQGDDKRDDDVDEQASVDVVR